MPIEVVPNWLSEERVKELQRKHDLMVQTQQKEYTEVTDRHFAELKELKERQRAESTQMYREDPDLSFAVAAGLVRWRTR